MEVLVPDYQSGVPTDRLCPPGEPNQAMGARVPHRRMVPTLQWRAKRLRCHPGCQGKTGTDHTQHSCVRISSQSTNALLCLADKIQLVTRSGADAGCKTINIRWMGKACL